MSNPSAAVPRPRRASRVPARLGDENGTAAALAGPRVMGKAVLGSTALPLGRPGLATKGISTAATVGTGAVAAKAGARRALGDVSNAGQSISSTLAAERSAKDGLAVKPSRSRTTSANSTTSAAVHPPSSTGTGFSRLKIGPTLSSALASLPLATNRTAALKTKPVQEQQHQLEAHLQVPRERDLNGLGLKTDDGQDWSAREMYAGGAATAEGLDADVAMNSADAQSIPLISVPSLKRTHDEEETYVDAAEVVEDDEAEAEAKYFAGGNKVHAGVDVLEEDDPSDWVGLMNVDEAAMEESVKAIGAVRDAFEEPLDFWDTTMVAEYSEEIFTYMSELEDQAMPNPRYMDHQTEIEWTMRTTLIDWLLQVHARYHMLPETLWIAVNIIDRFLSNRVVSLVKFQLVGVTAMFIAAKYEEIMAPSVDEFVYMTESGYTKDEIIKGERIILQSLEFNISPYCSPYSWVRRISKADDYDIQTRTLSKFLMEVTLLDHRFLRAKPSMIAAIGMYLARRMLGGAWNEDFIYYSNYTEAQLVVPTGFLLQAIVEDEFEKKFVYKKYGNKKFLKASIFARNWAKANSLTA